MDVTPRKLTAVRALLSMTEEISHHEVSNVPNSPAVLRTGWSNGVKHFDTGIMNIGLSSHVNACVQALFHIPVFLLWIENQRQCHYSLCQHKECIICFLIDTHAQYQKRACFAPLNLLSLLPSICPEMLVGKSDDVLRFMLGLLNLVDVQLTRSKNCNLMLEMFYGSVRVKVTCQICGLVDCHLHVMEMISIEAYKTIEKGIEDFIESLQVCSQCGTVPETPAEVSFQNFPKVLIVSVRRFNDIGERNNSHPFLPAWSITVRGAPYILCAIIYHSGATLSEGFYSCACVCPDGSIKLIEDSLVKSVSYGAMVTSRTFTNNCYIFMYEAVNVSHKDAHETFTTNEEREPESQAVALPSGVSQHLESLRSTPKRNSLVSPMRTPVAASPSAMSTVTSPLVSHTVTGVRRSLNITDIPS